MGEVQSLAPLPQQTLAGWHEFVATGDQDLLAKRGAPTVVLQPQFHRGVERIQGVRETFDCSIDRTRVVHRPPNDRFTAVPLRA